MCVWEHRETDKQTRDVGSGEWVSEGGRVLVEAEMGKKEEGS